LKAPSLADEIKQEKPADPRPADWSQVHNTEPIGEPQGPGQGQRACQMQQKHQAVREALAPQGSRRFLAIAKQERVQRRSLPHRIDKHVPRKGNHISAGKKQQEDAHRDCGKGLDRLGLRLDDKEEGSKVRIQEVQRRRQEKHEGGKRRPPRDQGRQNSSGLIKFPLAFDGPEMELDVDELFVRVK
jgi:hypothetical protein